MSEKNELLAGRVTMTVAILFAGYLGMNPPGFAAGTVALAFGLAASSIFPALMMGIFSKKMSGKAAVSGMIAGIGVTMLYVFQHKGVMFIPGTSFLGDMGPNWFFGISPNAFGSVGALVNFAVAFAMLKVTGPAPAEIQDMVDHMRVPTGAGAAHDH
jgi:cation/acetate symporter